MATSWVLKQYSWILLKKNERISSPTGLKFTTNFRGPVFYPWIMVSPDKDKVCQTSLNVNSLKMSFKELRLEKMFLFQFPGYHMN